ncbi:TIGR02678 family protein [Cohnella sp. REN36]|uniref:TIGR02678 family protein n=1 Tax=Cohnella sp. REN36 TaxID=2887347 RepID=UPI001D13AABA|nr:TIGR02678 family protein [Cohnella sp. REN36]MCC3377589.1 TIGR02678 family protein [Cohnella sp. REN36]
MSRGGAKSWAIRRMRQQGRTDAALWDERRRLCAQVLLNRPWVTKEDNAELFYWIKDQYAELRDWFAEYAGFSLLLTRTMAKLDKAPLKAEPWMGFREFRETRDYAFFAYGLWFLESKTEMDQFLLTDMVTQIREQMLGASIAVAWDNYYHRLSMVRALKKMKQLGVLIAVDGDEGDWASDESRNVLYECSPFARYVLRQFPDELRRSERFEGMSELVAYADTEEGRLRRLRHRVYRRLLLEPVVHDRHWDAEELRYVQTQRRSLTDQLQRMFGLEGTRYREGLLFFYPELSFEGELFPTPAAISDLVLLLAGELRRKQQREHAGYVLEDDGTIVLTRSDLEQALLELKSDYQDYWSKEHRELSASQLADELAAHMEEWSLGGWRDDSRFVVYPIVSRWNGYYQESMDGG